MTDEPDLRKRQYGNDPLYTLETRENDYLETIKD